MPTNEIISSKLDDTNLGMDHVQDQHPNVDAPLQAGLFASYQTNVFSPFRNMVSYYICVIMNLLHDSATCRFFLLVLLSLPYFSLVGCEVLFMTRHQKNNISHSPHLIMALQTLHNRARRLKNFQMLRYSAFRHYIQLKFL